MESRLCGDSGLRVSELGLGTLTWGRDTDLHEAIDMLQTFVEAGGNLLEGAPTHGDGAAPDVIGEAIRSVSRRRVCLVWRAGSRVLPGGVHVPSAGAADMLSSLDDCLARMGTDYVDLWLVGPDPDTPLEESLSAAERAFKSGRAAYVGVSHRNLWDTAQAVWAGQHNEFPRITAAEEEFSLLYAREGAQLRAHLTQARVGLITHSPLAGGVLTGKYRHTTPPDSRAASEHLAHLVRPVSAASGGIVEALFRAAQGLDRSMTQVALVWAKDHPGVSSTVVGPRTLRQLDTLLDAAEETLPAPIREVLNEVCGA